MHGVFVLRSLPGHQGERSANSDINMWTESLVIEDNSVLLFVGSVVNAAAAAVEAKVAANPGWLAVELRQTVPTYRRGSSAAKQSIQQQARSGSRESLLPHRILVGIV